MAGGDARPSRLPESLHYHWRGWRFPYMGKCEEAMTIGDSARETSLAPDEGASAGACRLPEMAIKKGDARRGGGRLGIG
jgi:hypothetical protein